MRVFRLLFAGLDRFYGRFLLITLAGFLDGCVTFFIPVLLANYTASNFDPSALWSMIPWLLVLTFASHALQWVLRKYGEAFNPEYSMYLRLRYFRALESMSLKRLSGFHSGYLLSIIGTVADGLGGLANEIFWGLSRSAANIALFFYFLWLQSAGLAVANLAIMTAFIFLSSALTRRFVPITGELNRQRAAMVGRYADFAANVPTVKRLGVQHFAEARIEAVSRETLELVKRMQNFHAWRWFSLHTLFTVALVLTITYLLLRIAAGEVSASILILFVAAFTSVRMNAERLSENFRTVLELDTFVDTLIDVLKTDERARGALNPAGWKSIEFENVLFQHQGSSILISVPRFRLDRGEHVGISGPSGEGKTTFLHLVAGLLAPKSGTRKVDEANYDDISEVFFQEQMAVVSQEAELFHLSVRDNLLLGREFPDEQLTALLEELGLGDWLSSVEGGLDSIVGEKGVTVSQGQKQRLNLLRGYLLDREILLLDEPTSHLDQENRLRVLKFIDERCRNKTTIVVSHHAETLSRCTKVYRMQGNMLEQ